MMRKQAIFIVLALVLAVFMVGAVSAADSSDGGDTGDTETLNDDEQGETMDSGDNSSETLVDPIIGVKVNYEYADDEINPQISVSDSNGNAIDFTKTYDLAFQGYKLSFIDPNAVNGSQYTVTVAAPGYTTQNQLVSVFFNPGDLTDPNLYGSSVFNMQATSNYKLGREVTKKADQLLNFSAADEVLCITTAGLTYSDGTTTEDCLEGILNQAKGIITNGQGNLLILQKTRTDPVDFGFITKIGNSLRIAYFVNGSLTPVYVGTLSENMTAAEWNVVVSKFGDAAFPYASLANAWAVGLSTDILRQAAFHGHVCLGTISGQAMIQTLLKYYPPITESGLPLEGVSYTVVGAPGNSDDDAFIYSMDTTPGKRAYIGIDTMIGTDMAGFIRWDSVTNTGILIIMAFDDNAVAQQFLQETGLSAYSGISSELKFNKWLVEKLQNDPLSLVTIIKELDGLTEEQFHYLMGYEPSKGVTSDQAHGLDMDYINSLNLPTATRSNAQYATGTLTDEQIKQIGIDAANRAKDLFQAMGITLEKDDSNLMVLTSAGYVRINGQVSDMVFDGIYEILGSRLSRATLLPVHAALWKNLVFDFAYNNGSNIVTVSLKYDPVTGQLLDCSQNYNIEDVLLYDPPYDALLAWLYHNHVCGGSSPGYLITDYIFDSYPLGDDEKYIYVTTNDNCKDDILQYLLGVSPGAGTYYNLRLTTEQTKALSGNGTDVSILIKWNSKTNVGEVFVINWVGPRFAPGSNSYEEYIRLYNRDYSSPNLISAPAVSVSAHTWITRADLDRIVSNYNGNALQFVRELPVRTMADLIPVQGGSQTGQTSNGGSSAGINSGSYTGGSVGTSGPAVSAASQTSTTSAGDQSGQKSYEVSKASNKSEAESDWYVYGIVGVLALGGLAGFGFMRGGLGGKV